LKWATGSLVVLILIGGALYSRYRDISYLVFPALAGLMAAGAIQRLETCFWNAARRQKVTAIWHASTAWAKPVMAILAVVLLGAASQSVLLGYFAAASGVVLCIRLLPVHREGIDGAKRPSEIDRNLLKEIWVYVLPLFPQALVGWVILFSDRYIINGLLGREEVGVYAICYGMIGTPFLLAGASLSQTMRPPYFNAVSSGDKYREEKFFRTWLTGTILISALGMIAIYCLRHWIAVILLAEEYRYGASLIPWITTGIGLQIIAQVFDSALFAYKRTKLILLSQIIGAIVCVVSVYLLTIQFGLIGAAGACPVYFLTLVIIKMLLVRKVTKSEQ
jgi:O-antigen/teichoic acid export membrane protein